MRIAVIGGYGVFGGRLCQLLRRDGHEVLVVGRNPGKARAFAARHGGIPVALDLSDDLSALFDATPDVVVDAAGPFQLYGNDPYRLPRACIENGVHYLDLADDARYVAGIGALDSDARAAGVIVLSGVSSVPALSSAAVRTLAAPLSRLDLISTFILPGNRAPRGRSVLNAILSQVGEPMELWRGGVYRLYRGWSQTETVELLPDLTRRASIIGAPDLLLFPDCFGVRSVLFRAGLELSILHRGLEVLSWLRGMSLIGPLKRWTSLLLWLANLVEGFGSDRGGMTVRVVGAQDGEHKIATWTLVADAGEGPFVPAVPARAIIARIASIPAGARPCLAELTLSDFEAAVSDLKIATTASVSDHPTLFRAALGELWHELPPAVRRMHSVQDIESFSGRAEVTRGTSILARLAAAFFRFPKAGTDVPLTITKSRTSSGEIWERNFAGRVFRSYLTPSGPGRYKERFWLFNYEQDLPVLNATLHLPVRRGWFAGIPLPRFLLPASRSREFAVDGQFRFDVGLHAPLGGGLIVRYQGWVEPDAPDPSPASTKSRRESVSRLP